MSRDISFPKLGVYGKDLSRELSLLESSIATKFKQDDADEFGPLRYVGPFTSVANAQPWDILAINPTARALTIILPAPNAAGAIGSWIGVKNDSASTNTVTVKPLTRTIDGAATFAFTTARRFQWFYSDGKEWKVGPSSSAQDENEIRVDLSTNQNNWSPPGWSAARNVYINVTANCNISGMDANVTQFRKTIIHVGTVKIVLGFLEEKLTSTAANRISMPNPNDLYMLKGWAQDWLYDRTALRWRPV